MDPFGAAADERGASTNPFDDPSVVAALQMPAAMPPPSSASSAMAPPAATMAPMKGTPTDKASGDVYIPMPPIDGPGSLGPGDRPTALGSVSVTGFGYTDTLDEPVTTTVWRDLRNIGTKITYVLVPRKGKALLRDWDLWGPLLLCLTLAIILSVTAPSSQSAIVFTGVFVIIWCGAGVVTLNSKLLGGQLSFFQSVCVLGYCVFPLVLASLVCLFVPLFLIRLALVAPSFGWSTWASLIFLTDTRLERRKALAVYPIFLFYFVISWIIVISKSVV